MNAAAGETLTSPQGAISPSSKTGVRVSSPRDTYMKSGSVREKLSLFQSGGGRMAASWAALAAPTREFLVFTTMPQSPDRGRKKVHSGEFDPPVSEQRRDVDDGNGQSRVAQTRGELQMAPRI